MKIKEIVKLVLNDIASVYSYMLAFYAISLFLSFFFESWNLFFDWRAFNIIIIVFGILSLLSEKSIKSIKSIKSKVHKVYKVYKVEEFIKHAPESRWGSKVYKVMKSAFENLKVGNFTGLKFAMLESYRISKKELGDLLIAAKNDLLERKMKMAESALKIFGGIFLKAIYEMIKIVKVAAFSLFFVAKQIFKVLIYLVVLKIKRLRKTGYLKTGIIAIILVYAVAGKINVIDFLILAYALVSILFVLDSRIAAGIALLFLASVPFFLIEKKDGLAEIMAIYAYYFLVITVLTQIGEYRKEEKVAKRKGIGMENSNVRVLK